MRISDGRLLLSPTDVVDAVACSHRAATALRVAHGVAAPLPFGGLASILSAGRQHEDAVLAAFEARGLRLVDLSGATADVDAWQLRAELTLAELSSGRADVVLQGAVVMALEGARGVPVLARRAQGRAVLTSGRTAPLLVGRPDFLVRTPAGWRVEDAKLARSLKPTALLQTALYREALAAAGVAVHDDLRLHLGHGEAADEPARGVQAWARRQLADVVALLADLTARGALDPGFSLDVEWCTACDDTSPCGQARAAADHLGGVADLRRDQARRLVAAGITTIAALAATPGSPSSPVPGMAPATFEALREQASLQVAARVTGSIGVVVRPHPATVREGDVRPGLWGVPEPDPGDVFFDMEGDPLWTAPIGGPTASADCGARTRPGLEYLFGATHDGSAFTPFWAHDRSQEGAAFTEFVDWVQARRLTHPGLHVYHYAAYEKTALVRLASAHASRGDVIDEWLVSGVLVDLYTAVRQGLRAGIPSYSIKKVEHLYGRAHTGDVADAGASIEKYEEYRATGSSEVLRQIADYNRDDCDSTRDLRDYLLRLRADAVARGGIAPLTVVAAPVPDDDALDVEAPPPSPTAELRERLAAATATLLDGADPGAPIADPAAEARRVLAGLLGYQVREEKAAWQDVFRVAEEVAGDPCAAVDDAKVLGGLQPTGELGAASGKRVAWTFTAPAQEHALAKGGALAAVAGRPVDVSTSDPQACDEGSALMLTVSMNAAKAAAAGWSPQVPPPLDALLPSKIIQAKAQQESLLDLADLVSDQPRGPAIDDPSAPRAAARALLLGRASLDVPALPPPLAGEDGVAHVVRLASSSDGAAGLCLAVQGPPGAGKSYLGAEVVDALITRAQQSGRAVRIGVTANSHEVVLELLRSIHRRTPSACVRHFDGKHSTAKDPSTWTRFCPHEDCAEPALITGRREGWAQAQVIGGTAWAFSRPDAPPLDVLVVDEAGQMSLGDVLACARGVATLLLLGDPQQLAKPSAAAHPDGVAVSALEHLMRGRATMPPETGVFLDATRRMHPDVTTFISDIAYDGRLRSDDVCSTRAVVPAEPGDVLAGTGLRLVPVEHVGNTQSCAEEVDAVVALVEQLVGRRWQRTGEVVALDADQVLVVSPFTAQVRALQAALSARGLQGVRAGTVDKFQGKEAAVVVYSTAASDAESAPRGLGFLYDVHRLNVAVSRAQCLAFWVGSPALLRPRVSTVEHVRLVNALCRFADEAVVVTGPAAALAR